MPQTARNQLLRALTEHSLLLGEFTLASGRTSTYYVDSKKTTMRQETRSLVGEVILQEILQRGIEADAIGGLTLGADPIAFAVVDIARLRGLVLQGFSVRKEAKSHGTKRYIEGVCEKGDRVIIVDDVITTGGSTIKAIESVREEGCDVVMVIALVDREEGGIEAIQDRVPGVPATAIFKISELLEAKGKGERTPVFA